MKKMLNIINQILGVIAYGSGMTLVVIGLSSWFSVLELVLIATCTAILHIGLSETLKRMNNRHWLHGCPAPSKAELEERSISISQPDQQAND